MLRESSLNDSQLLDAPLRIRLEIVRAQRGLNRVREAAQDAVLVEAASPNRAGRTSSCFRRSTSASRFAGFTAGSNCASNSCDSVLAMLAFDASTCSMYAWLKRRAGLQQRTAVSAQHAGLAPGQIGDDDRVD